MYSLSSSSAHTTNKLVELVVSWAGETRQTFHGRDGGNAMYTTMAVVEFVNALGTWVEESPLKRLHKAPFLASWLMNALMLLP